MRDRQGWIDVAKGIGIVAVVVGHVATGQPGAWSVLKQGVYLFHMPLFFFLSGYLFRPADPGTLAARKARSLLVPYASFLVVLLALTVAGRMASGEDLELGELALGALLGGPYLGGILLIFWFVSSLYLAQLAYAWARLRWAPLSPALGLLAGGALALAYALHAPPPGVLLPYSIDAVPLAFACLWAGDAVAAVGIRSRGATAAALAATVACLLLAQAGVVFTLDVKYGNYGPVGVGAVLALALSLLVCRASMWVARVPRVGGALAAIGQASLVIMFLHQFFVATLIRAGLPPLGNIAAGTLLPMLAYAVMLRVPALSTLFLGQRTEARQAGLPA